MGVLRDYDQDFLGAAIDELEDYLLSKDLFWPLRGGYASGRIAFPQLTLGAVLLSVAVNRACQPAFQKDSHLIRIENQLAMVRSQWRAAWNEKIIWEFNSRLRQWGNYLNDILGNKAEFAPYYGFEVRWRVVLELLKNDLDEIEPEILDMLLAMDATHQSYFRAGDFIWEKELMPGFGKETYWYLWGDLGQSF